MFDMCIKRNGPREATYTYCEKLGESPINSLLLRAVDGKLVDLFGNLINQRQTRELLQDTRCLRRLFASDFLERRM